MGHEIPKKLVLGCGAFFGVSMFAGCLGAVGMALFRPADVHIHHDGPITVEVDGNPLELLGSGVDVVELERGDHTLVIDGTTWDMAGMNGLDDWLIPADEETCFVQLDVSYALYEVASVFDTPGGDLCPVEDVRVIDRYVDFPRYVAGPNFRLADLPETTGGNLVFLTLAVPCDEVDEVNGSKVLGRELGCPELPVRRPRTPERPDVGH